MKYIDILPALWRSLITPKYTYNKEKTMTAKIIETTDGYVLLDKSDLTIGTYSRRRDAVRGAARRGFSIAA